MAYSSRPNSMLPPGSSAASLRQPSNAIAQQQSSALAARIAAKKTELENLNQVRDMSSGLAVQMENLQAKLETLKDGTEAVACVLANWDNVIRAITMASTKFAGMKSPAGQPSNSDTNDSAPAPAGPYLPSTLVRIPAAHQQKPGDP